MESYWGRKQKRSGTHGAGAVWRQKTSDYRRPPLAGQRKESKDCVPEWEKKFCESICKIPWHKLLESQRFIHLYDNVMSWNDTAAEEAFKNAKSRFWAEMNGLPCESELPDPDLYIDKVDWNSKIDPELLLELEKALKVDRYADVTCAKPLMLNNYPVVCDGWGDLDGVPEPVLLPPTGWDDDDNLNDHHGYYSSPKKMTFGSTGENQAPPNRGFNYSRRRRRQHQSQWQEKDPTSGRW